MKKNPPYYAKRIAALILVPVAVILVLVYAESIYEKKLTQKSLHINNNDSIATMNGFQETPLLIHDGTEINSLEDIDLSDKEIQYLQKDTAVERYGEKGKHGVIIVTTKK
jgi:hypothetical protein